MSRPRLQYDRVAPAAVKTLVDVEQYGLPHPVAKP
jgi:hypothetical protein